MKQIKELKTYYFQCDCASQEHTIGITFDSSVKEMCFEVQLSKYHGFFGRIWVAVKYVFGYECKYGHWDTAIMSGDKVVDFHRLVTRFILQAGFKNSAAGTLEKIIQNEYDKNYKNKR